MKKVVLLWLLTISCYFGLAQSAKCPTFCVCYKWQMLLRIDCVHQGLIDVNIGLDNGDGGKGGGFAGAIYPVQVLDLSHNSISSLQGGVFNSITFARLECLHLHHNSIAHISASALQGLGHLKLLDLSYNRLRRNHGILSGSITPHSSLLLAQLFKDSPNLRALRLGSNPLENEDFHGKNSDEDGEPFLIAPKLEFLDLGSCHLGHIGHKSFDGLESLKMLNLSDNQLISLDPVVFENMTHLMELSLNANPWPCDQMGEMEVVENWLSSKKLSPVCPKKKFEKIVVSNPKAPGPQKAEDDRTLLYYYQRLGIMIEDFDSHTDVQHPHIDYPDDVEVFDERALDPQNKPFEEVSYLDSNISEESEFMRKFPCPVYGIPIIWLILSFLAGNLLSFLCTFHYYAKPCSIGNCCSNFSRMIRQTSSSESRRRYMRRIKSFSRGESSLAERGNSRRSGEMYSLIDSSEPDLHNLGLTTPVLPRATSSTRRTLTQTPPPTYEEHLALHAIRTDP